MLYQNQRREIDMLERERLAQIERIEGGQNQYFEQFTKSLDEIIAERQAELEALEEVKGPSTEEYLSKLLLNVGHMNSFEAIDKSRKIPNG
jgi:hypothetical protein